MDKYSLDKVLKTHPNGGGRVCHDSQVEDSVFVDSETIIVNSEIRGNSRVEGRYIIKNTYANRLEIESNPERAEEYGLITDCYITDTTIYGYIHSTACRIYCSELRTIKEPFEMEYFSIGHSFLGGKFELIGIPSKRTPPLDGFRPSIACSHLEGEISLTLPYVTSLRSVIIKPVDAPLKKHPSRTTLLRMLECAPEIPFDVT
jgi:hypothetical protein